MEGTKLNNEVDFMEKLYPEYVKKYKNKDLITEENTLFSKEIRIKKEMIKELFIPIFLVSGRFQMCFQIINNRLDRNYFDFGIGFVSLEDFNNWDFQNQKRTGFSMNSSDTLSVKYSQYENRFVEHYSSVPRFKNRDKINIKLDTNFGTIEMKVNHKPIQLSFLKEDFKKKNISIPDPCCVYLKSGYTSYDITFIFDKTIQTLELVVNSKSKDIHFNFQ